MLLKLKNNVQILFWIHFGMIFPQTRSYKVESFGSGVIYNRHGYIITNEHVIKNASEIYITTNDGEKHKAELIGVDELTDIALLKINISNLNPIVLGDSDDLIIGEWVVALGKSFGFVYIIKPCFSYCWYCKCDEYGFW